MDQNGDLQKEKLYTWSEKHWLKSLEIRTAEKTLYKTTYAYDLFGNPIMEIFSGDLTGEGACEEYTILREFSQDGRNLLIKEEHENGKIINYTYLPGTNLVTSKITKDKSRILLSELFLYDQGNHLIKSITDDGEGTAGLITDYVLRQSPPFLHMPEIIEDKDLDGKLLKRSVLTYDKYGFTCREDVYDANETFAYSLNKEFNERGDLISETNALGQKAYYTYDERGLLKTVQDFSGRLHKTLHRDKKGRLREELTEGNDGVAFTSRYCYDDYDRPVEKIDPFKNSTYYTIDSLTNQNRRIDFPPIASSDGQPIPVTTHSTYDPFGNPLTQTDANGNTISIRYNAYGSPIEVVYPDGNHEIYRYEKSGALVSHTDRSGLRSIYIRDALGKVLSKVYLSSQGERLAEERFDYRGRYLVAETNKEGFTVYHSYDRAGRKIREEFFAQTTEYKYDSLGNVCTIFQNNLLVTQQKWDLLGRLLEENKRDSQGNLLHAISYTYDEAGNKKTVTKQSAVDIYTYDSIGRLTCHINPLGKVTKSSYNEIHPNGLGQLVLQIATVDPLGITTLETEDAFGHLVLKQVFDKDHSLLSQQKTLYDPYGNITYLIDSVIEEGMPMGSQTVKYTYTSVNLRETVTKAFGSPDERTIRCSYWPSGKIATKTLPDGVTLLYEYDLFGFTKGIRSSNEKIHHTFIFDKLGRLKGANDEKLRLHITRELDPFGNVVKETSSTGFQIIREYDLFGRPTLLNLGTFGALSYSYDPLYLRSVNRLSPEGQSLYAHTYTKYDLCGNLLSEQLIGALGAINHTLDSTNREISLSSPYFIQECIYGATGELQEDRMDGAKNCYSYDGLSQCVEENGHRYINDSVYNRTTKNGIYHQINALNELLRCDSTQYAYDTNGNQILRQTPDETFHFVYDSLNRLVSAQTNQQRWDFIYDPLGRRLAKISFTKTADWQETSREYYLYDEQHEIGSFTQAGELHTFRVLGRLHPSGIPSTIAIETDSRIYAPILDVHGNIRRLINAQTATIAESYDFTAFGEEQKGITFLNPWRFASKRIDSELGLVFFGKRYYDPLIARWGSCDPFGCIDSINLYQFVFNNPFSFSDPNGEFIFSIPFLVWGVGGAGLSLSLPALSTIVAPIRYGTVAGTALYGGLKAFEIYSKRQTSDNGPKGGHSSNVRESTRGTHEKADARRQREQRKAEERRNNRKKR